MATRKEIQSALQHPYDRMLFSKQILHPVFGSSFKLLESVQIPFVEPTKSESSVISEVLIYGTITLEDGTDITCYEVTLQPTVSIEQSKVAIQHYVRKLLISGQAALINFIAPEDKDIWRFTLVAKDSKITNDGIAETHTHPRRYTYLVEKDRPNRTMAERLETLSLESEIDLEKLITAFSVEAMSKAFFDEYKEHYQNFVEYLTGKRMVKQGGKWVEKQTGKASPFLAILFNSNEKDARDFIKKLMGRIVFLYFVQKKRWLGASTTEYNDGPYDFIFRLFDQTGGDERFFPFGLSELFFNALNKERKDDDWKIPSGKVVKIPYLNGGLFVRDEIDEKIHEKGDLLTFPPGLFSHVDKMDTPNDRGFLDFLNAYNFTVYEDSQDDHTVAVDPEMLGHIFENLLEDNKDKGAFYTPKEIVHYMCQESLIEYLVTNLAKEYKVYRELDDDQVELFGNESRTGQLKMIKELGDNALNRKEVEHLVKEKDIKNLSSDQIQRIDELLSSVKICDPAIGSGAFPMGLLQEIFSIKEASAYLLDKPFNAARTKENIISNSIYGVDIEKGAVDIARLRFWLSLVVDEEQPRALPNLDYKIVVGNSLVSKFEDEIIEIDWERKASVGKADEYIKQLQETLTAVSEKQKQFFDPESANKADLKKEIRNLKIDALLHQHSFNKEVYMNKTPQKGGFAPNATEIKHNLERELTIKGFDQVLGKLRKVKNNPEKPFEHFDWKLDFPEVLNPIVVGENGGFDIMIANPPYIKEYTNRAAFDGFRESPYYQGRMDIWYGFACKSIDMLKKDGIECFIAQNNWITSYGASILRNKVVNDCEIKLFTDFGNYKVFESAGIQTMIYVIQSREPRENYDIKYSVLKNDSISKDELLQFLDFSNENDNSNKFWFAFKEPANIGKIISFSNSLASTILDRIESKANFKLSEKEVIQGLVGAPDKAFIIDDSEIKNYNRAEVGLLKKYYTNASGVSNEMIFYLSSKILTRLSKDIYPNLYSKLSSYRSKLDGRREVLSGQIKWFNLQWPRNEEFFKSGDKIICQIRAERPNFLFTDMEYYVSRATNIIKSDRMSMKCLTAILNSNLIYFYYRHRGASQGNILKFDKGPLLKIPIRKPSPRVSKAFEKLVTEMLDNKASGKNTEHLEQEIDSMVYHLYDLTYDEVKVIDSEFALSKKVYEEIKLE